ncbi:MAG: hypothetical protein PF483_13965 [Halothiobacillus sp.]|jgi:hypothetical protein|nr:hypothetical protein [Halothiobacillus sp.]
MSINDHHKKAVISEALAEIRPELRAKILSLIDTSDTETSGVVVAMHLAGLEYIKALGQSDDHLESMNRALDTSHEVFEQMTGALTDLTQAAERLEKSSESSMDAMKKESLAAEEALLKSFGSGLVKSLPTVLGTVLNPLVDKAVDKALDKAVEKALGKHFQIFSMKTGLAVTGAAVLALLIGVGIGFLLH